MGEQNSEIVLELCVKSTCLWVVVSPSNLCFIPNPSVAVKWPNLHSIWLNWVSVEKFCKILFDKAWVKKNGWQWRHR
jgi:hypothetical protein